MSEGSQRAKVVKALRSLHAVAIENTAGVGTPDINYVGGWIECKQLDNWPKRADSVVRLHHDLTVPQRIWLKRRRRAGGRAWVLLQVGRRDWLLFDGEVAADILGSVTKSQLFEQAAWSSTTGLDEQALRNALTCSQTETHRFGS